MNNSYLWLKVVHLFGVVLFLGNIIVTGCWKNMADLTRNPQIIAYAQRQVTLTDFIFTAGGAAILLVAGMVNIYLHDMSYSAKWLNHGYAIFLASGVIWAAILIPVQIKQAKNSQRICRERGDSRCVLEVMYHLEYLWRDSDFTAFSKSLLYGV